MTQSLSVETKTNTVTEGCVVTNTISNSTCVPLAHLKVEVTDGLVWFIGCNVNDKNEKACELTGCKIGSKEDEHIVFMWDTTGMKPGNYTAKVTAEISKEKTITSETTITVQPRPISRGDTLPVTLRRTDSLETKDQALWVVIRNSTNQVSFKEYMEFVTEVMCMEKDAAWQSLEPQTQTQQKPPIVGLHKQDRSFPFSNMEMYKLLKVATEVFLMRSCGVYDFDNIDTIEENRRLGRGVTTNDLDNSWSEYKVSNKKVNDSIIPYYNIILNKMNGIPIKDDDSDNCYGFLKDKLTNPCFIELIWSYWHEEGMQVQAMNAISLRFQNKRRGIQNDPLANLEIDPLRPLNNILWGYIQDEQHRLSVQRRAYEYDHHYGLTLQGKAISGFMPADSRSKFIEAFHNLLHLCSNFFKENDDTTRFADGFPVLNGLKEVHLLLSQGAHNQYGDLPWTARQEMLMQQWLLARPEMREFLPTRVMVAHPEPWMGQVEAMNKLQGWTDTSVLHFHDLAVFGEQILLSIRYGAWTDAHIPDQAANWARYWRPEIQGYIHAYRSVTGVDLTTDAANGRKVAERYVKPSILLQRRLAAQRAGR